MTRGLQGMQPFSGLTQECVSSLTDRIAPAAPAGPAAPAHLAHPARPRRSQAVTVTEPKADRMPDTDHDRATCGHDWCTAHRACTCAYATLLPHTGAGCRYATDDQADREATERHA